MQHVALSATVVRASPACESVKAKGDLRERGGTLYSGLADGVAEECNLKRNRTPAGRKEGFTLTLAENVIICLMVLHISIEIVGILTK